MRVGGFRVCSRPSNLFSPILEPKWLLLKESHFGLAFFVCSFSRPQQHSSLSIHTVTRLLLCPSFTHFSSSIWQLAISGVECLLSSFILMFLKGIGLENCDSCTM